MLMLHAHHFGKRESKLPWSQGADVRTINADTNEQAVGWHEKQKGATQGSHKPEVLGANVKIADKAKIEGKEGVEAGGWRLQHGDNVYGPGLAFADSMCSGHYVPHACTPASSLSDSSTPSRAGGNVSRDM